MHLVTVREFRVNPAKVWKDLGSKGDLVLTNNGHPVAILSPADDATVEERLRQMRRMRAMEAVERIQRRSIEQNLDQTTPEAVQKIINRVRKGNRG